MRSNSSFPGHYPVPIQINYYFNLLIEANAGQWSFCYMGVPGRVPGAMSCASLQYIVGLLVWISLPPSLTVKYMYILSSIDSFVSDSAVFTGGWRWAVSGLPIGDLLAVHVDEITVILCFYL